MTAIRSFRCCGVRIDGMSLDQAADAVVTGRATGAVHLCNAFTLSLTERDPSLRAALSRSSLNLADGMPLVWIARRLGLDHLRERVYGPDLMERCLERGSTFEIRHALFGSTPDVLDRLVTEIQRRWPDARIASAVAPPMSELPASFDAAFDDLVASDAQVIWVGLGTPKQDLVVDRFGELAAERGISGLTFVAIGAAFDFIAGTKAQAPGWMRSSGLEWLHRLVTEPRRLWRRYLIGNTRFLWSLVRTRPRLLDDLRSDSIA